MGRLARLFLTGLSFLPLCVLVRSLSTIETCVNNGLSLFTDVDYKGQCQPISFEALDNTHQASCVDVNSTLPIFSIIKTRSVSCCFLYEQSCPDRSSPFYPQRPNLMSQRVFVWGIPNLSRYGWGGDTIKSIVCPDAATCQGLKQDETMAQQDVWVEKLVKNPYTGQRSTKRVQERRDISLRPYWLDLQTAEGHQFAI